MPKQVTTDYDAIAHEWDRTRQNAWGEFEFATDLLIPPPSLLASSELRRTGPHLQHKMQLLDAGCGNGRLINWLRKKNFQGKYLGIDSSEGLLEKAKQNFPKEKFQKIDLLDFKELESFDLVFCIAVLHHLPDKTSRLRVLQNIYAGLKSEGKLFLTVWNLWQPRYIKYVLKSYFTKNPRDCKIPFANKVDRFVHAFSASELIDLLEKAGFQSIEVFPAKKEKRVKIFSARNLVVIAKK